MVAAAGRGTGGAGGAVARLSAGGALRLFRFLQSPSAADGHREVRSTRVRDMQRAGLFVGKALQAAPHLCVCDSSFSST